MSSDIEKNISKIINEISPQELNAGKISDDKKTKLQQIFINSEFNEYQSHVIKMIKKKFEDVKKRNVIITDIIKFFNEEKRKQEQEKLKQEEETRKKNRIQDLVNGKLVNRNIIETQKQNKQKQTLPTEKPQQNASIFEQNDYFPMKEKNIHPISPSKTMSPHEMSTEVSDEFENSQKDLTKNMVMGEMKKLQKNTNEKYSQFFELVNTKISANLITYEYKYALDDDKTLITFPTALNQIIKNLSNEQQLQHAKKHFIDAIVAKYKKDYPKEIAKMDEIIKEQEINSHKSHESHKHAEIYPETSHIKEYVSVHKYDKLKDYENMNLEYDFHHELTENHKEKMKNVKMNQLTIAHMKTIYEANQVIKQEQTEKNFKQNNNHIFVVLFEKITNNNEICDIECENGDKLNNAYLYDTLYFTESDVVHQNIMQIFKKKI